MLIDYRESNGISQLQLAKYLDVSQSAVAKWELKKSEPTATNILAISNLLGISASELLGDSFKFQPTNKKKSEIQLLYDELSPQQQASLIGYAKGMLANSGKDLNKLVSDKK